MRCCLTVSILLGLGISLARGHDIPNARVDRSIQATVTPARLAIDYEVGLSELTLTQDLRALVGTLPGGDRNDWFAEYARVSGPLNAKGLLVSVDDRPIDLHFEGFELKVEDHPRFTFHFRADLPERGRLSIRDTNYEAGEGTSRLALRGLDGVAIKGDGLPGEVAAIAIQPVWQMTDPEERRTRQVVADYAPGSEKQVPAAVPPEKKAPIRSASDGLSRLLDRSRIPVFGLWLIALGLGAAHAIQPGHGKTLVAAASVGEGGGWSRGVILAITITIAHIGGVLAVAAILWATRSTRYPDINRILAHAAGFIIASVGLWRLGRHLGGYNEHDAEDATLAGPGLGTRGLIGLGLAGGVVPCWDAVVLIVLAEAVGRIGLGLVLLWAFSTGMALVLVAVGLLAAHLRTWINRNDDEGIWTRRLGLLSGLAVSAIGLYLMMS